MECQVFQVLEGYGVFYVCDIRVLCRSVRVRVSVSFELGPPVGYVLFGPLFRVVLGRVL